MHAPPVGAWAGFARVTAVSFGVVLVSSHLFSVAKMYLETVPPLHLVSPRENLWFRYAPLEDTKKIADEEDEKHSAKANSGSAAGAPPTVAVVTAAPAENQHQDNNDYDEHI
jgi:hypothetical protein